MGNLRSFKRKLDKEAVARARQARKQEAKRKPKRKEKR